MIPKALLNTPSNERSFPRPDIKGDLLKQGNEGVQLPEITTIGAEDVLMAIHSSLAVSSAVRLQTAFRALHCSEYTG
jgi:hypothetical protein